MKNGILVCTLLCSSLLVFAQTESNEPVDNFPTDDFGSEDLSEYFSFVEDESLVMDGAYERQIHKERVALKLDDIREADVLWSKRIWREINTKEKINRPFNNKKMPFINVLMDIVQKKEDVRLYSSDKFTEEVPKNAIWERMSAIDSVEVWDYELEDYKMTQVANEMNLEEFTKFRIKEDWVFDSKSSKMVCRIIGLAPVREVIDPNTGLIRGQEVLFWIHFPQVRDYMASYEAINPANDAVTLSWTDVWDMRIFSSQIMKESNPMDRRISAYATGRDALLEARAIREKMLNFELDLWDQ